MLKHHAGVAELADAQDLKSCGGDIVPVRFRSPALAFKANLIEYVCVAQLDRALGYGPRCRGFESSHARPREYRKPLIYKGLRYFFV